MVSFRNKFNSAVPKSTNDLKRIFAKCVTKQKKDGSDIRLRFAGIAVIASVASVTTVLSLTALGILVSSTSSAVAGGLATGVTTGVAGSSMKRLKQWRELPKSS